MTSAYWEQWDKSDLDSWQGKDLVDEDDADLEHDEDDANLTEEEQEEAQAWKDDPCCGGRGCNSCYSLSY